MSTCYNNLFGDVSAKYIIMHQDALRKRTPNTGDAIDAKCVVVRTCVGLQSSSSPQQLSSPPETIEESLLNQTFNVSQENHLLHNWFDRVHRFSAFHVNLTVGVQPEVLLQLLLAGQPTSGRSRPGPQIGWSP